MQQTKSRLARLEGAAVAVNGCLVVQEVERGIYEAAGGVRMTAEQLAAAGHSKQVVMIVYLPDTDTLPKTGAAMTICLPDNGRG